MKKRNFLVFAVALLFLCASAFVFVHFLDYHEAKIDVSGWSINDPLFKWIPASDVSIFIFGITYGSIILYGISNYKKANFAVKLMFCYGLLLLFRMLTMTLIPLKEPDSLVYLQDPFLNNLIYPGNIDSDLFFSGHTALLMILFFLTKKWWFAVLGLLLGFLLILQRVHYTIDILAAIPFAFIIVRIVEILMRRLSPKN